MRKRWEVIAGKVAFRYQDVGHGTGDTMWWVDNAGKVLSQKFEGKFHHDVSRLDMDRRWRGRIDRSGTTTLLPPVNIYSRYDAEEIDIPDFLMNALEKMGARNFYVDTMTGMKRVAKK
jgi:hypothetical protein